RAPTQWRLQAPNNLPVRLAWRIALYGGVRGGAIAGALVTAVLRRYAAFLHETLPKIVAALLWIRMHRTVACDVEHRTDLIERLVVEPAFAPRPPDRVAIGGGLARPIQDMPAFVIVDQPLHGTRQILERLHVEPDHRRGDGEALEIAKQGC